MAIHKRKKIAVLIGHPEEHSHEQFLKGFLDEAFKLDYDVVVFAMYVKYQRTPERNYGDSSIFELINYDKFECVVVLGDTLQIKGLPEKIEERLHENYNGKVIFVDRDSKYFPSIHIDNYTPEKLVIDHLIEKHGIKDIVFLTGKQWHPHSIIRLNAYKDSLEEHGIPYDENKIFYGDFWYTSGESLADSFIKTGDKLPEAVACANDCMALGFAKAMTLKGYSVPGDIVVVGCDSNSEGKHAPIPLTSSPLSSMELGANAALMADSLITGGEEKRVPSNAELFIGGTCGCDCTSAVPTYFKRTSWDTELSLATMFSPFNDMDENLIAQTTLSGIIGTIFASIYLIRGFDGFDLCLNPSLGGSDVPYEDKMLHAIRCGSELEDHDRIMTDTYFDKDQILPGLEDDREKPSVYYVMPLFYDRSVFGFASIRFDDNPTVITSEYRAWLKSICRGIEYYRRCNMLISSSKIAHHELTVDNQTGLLNYKGFLEHADTLLNLLINNGGYMGALAVDIKNLTYINNTYGRLEGDNAITNVARAISNVFSSRNCICLRPGSDELVALKITREPDEREILADKDKLLAAVSEICENLDYSIDLYYGIEKGSPTTTEEMERLVNMAISRKNKNKADAAKVSAKQLTDEEKSQAHTVMQVLVDNKLNYNFQPIVESKTGKIYSYEALMRPDVDPYLPPPVILRYAEMYDRLYDVEKLTFSNVIKIMNKNRSTLSDGKKVFINSIPGHMLSDNDLKMLEDHIASMPGSVVVEFTEQSEISDDELKRMKDTFDRIGIETAVDDYGTGYSNVTNLLRYKPDYVKIDRSLLSGIENSPQKQHFVKDIIEFSHENDIKALAEGVETSEELKTVIMLGADLIQGYYTAMPAKEMIQSIDPDVADEIRKYSLLRDSVVSGS